MEGLSTKKGAACNLNHMMALGSLLRLYRWMQGGRLTECPDFSKHPGVFIGRGRGDPAIIKVNGTF